MYCTYVGRISALRCTDLASLLSIGFGTHLLIKHFTVIPRSSNAHHIQELARLLQEDQSRFLDNDDLRSVDAMKDSAS